MYFKDFYGVDLTHDECWEEYERMLNQQFEYDCYESGMSDVEILAIKSPEYAYKLIEMDKE